MSEYKTLQENQTLNLEYQRNKELREKEKEIERLNNVINKALHKLRASKDHFKTERENNVVTFVIRILEGSDK